MAQEIITIIGLGKVGCSIGLALSGAEEKYKLVGHDIDQAVAKKAVSINAVKSVSWNLIRACDKADVVILAIPLDQVKETLELIGPELKPGCVVVDTSPFKQDPIQWASQHLPDGVHFVGISPGINPAAMGNLAPGPAGAQADLFAESPCGIVPSPSCHPAAVQVAQDLAKTLGATPHFMDPAEFDGVSAAVNLMPGLVAEALLGPITDSPGWREMRRLASNSLVHFSQPLEFGSTTLAQAAVSNQESVLHWLDAAMGELQTIRQLIEQGEADQLMLYLDAAIRARNEWLVDWRINVWEKRPKTELPSSGSMLGQLFGVGRRKSEDD